MVAIKDYENYDIKEDGTITNSKGKILKGSLKVDKKSGNSYHLYTFRKNGKEKKIRLHRLLAIQFIPNPNNYLTVDHIDQDTLNNDLSNLRWADHSMQMINRSHYNNTLGHKYIYKKKCSKMKQGFYYHFEIKRYGIYINKSAKTMEEILKIKEDHREYWDIV